MNSKIGKLVIILILVCVFCIIVGGGLLLRDLSNPSGAKQTNSVDDTREAGTIDGIDEISVSTSSANVNIINSGDGSVKAHLAGSIHGLNNPEPPRLYVDRTGNKIDITVDSSNSVVFIGYSNMTLDVYIPSDYSKKLSLKSSSGNVNIDSYNLHELNASATSGNISMNNIECAGYDIYLSSGNIKGLNIKGSGKLKASSGNIILDKIQGSDINIKNSSGDINANIISGNINAETSSGNINVTYEKFDNNAVLKASSGNCTLKLPSNSEFSLKASANSGNVRCDLPVTITGSTKDHYMEGVVKSSRNSVLINTSSGNIKIY